MSAPPGFSAIAPQSDAPPGFSPINAAPPPDTGYSTNSLQKTTGISAQPKSTGIMDSIAKWSDNVANDIKYGTDVTGIGTVLKKMGAHGVYNGEPQKVGDFMASLPLGLLQAAKGGAELTGRVGGASGDPSQVMQGAKDVVGGLTNAATIPALADTGGTMEGMADLAEGATNLAKRVVSAPFRAAKATEAGRAVTQTLAPEVADAPIATTRNQASRGASTSEATEAGRAVTQTLPPEVADASIATTRNQASRGASTSITNREVLQHAEDMGIDLTPAQGLQTPAAKSEQTLGEEALLTGQKIKNAVAQSKSKLTDAMEDFQDRLDPQRGGMSPEAAGEHLQNSAEISRSVLKDNVNNAYDSVREQQADLAGDVQGPLQNLIHDESFARQPHAAVEQPVFQTGAAKSAIQDIQNMLQDPAMQGRQSVQSLRNLRTTLLEKGSDYGANGLADSGQRIYKLAAGKVDGAIMDAAQGTPFQETFRDAGAQNAKLQELYNQRGSPLYRILNTDDPAAVTNGILNRSSVHEIEQLKGENFDLGPLARQAVDDIQSTGFKVTPSGLGGYPDSFLRSLLGPDATKELYLKADVARRLAENYNPSGSGKVALGASQLLHPLAAVAAQAARVRSMPRAATSFLSDLAGK